GAGGGGVVGGGGGGGGGWGGGGGRAARPLIDRRLFADRRFTWGTAAAVAVSVALFGIMFVVPQYLQSVAGDDPVSAGLRLLPMVGGLLVAGGAASPVARAAGTRSIAAAGLALLTAGLAGRSPVPPGTRDGLVATRLGPCGLRSRAGISPAMAAVIAAPG